MSKVQATIERILVEHQEKAEKIATLQAATEWFFTHFEQTIFHHQDVRGGNVTPVVILGTAAEKNVDVSVLQTEFHNHPKYELFKKHLLIIGYSKTTKDTYYYISCNDSSDYSKEEVRDLLFTRVNNELFPHINKYFS